MAITCICPSCGSGVTLKERPIIKCPSCSNDFPASLKEKLNKEFRVNRPTLLSLFMYWNYFAGFIFCILTLMLIFSGEASRYHVHGKEVSKGEYMMFFLPVAFVMLPLIFFTIYGLKKEKPWIRAVLTGWIPLMLAIFLIQIFTLPAEVRSPILLAPPVIMTLVMTGFASWYLYAKKSSKAYFRELKFKSQR